MQIMKEKLIAAIEAKNNDVKTFIWKFPRRKTEVRNQSH